MTLPYSRTVLVTLSRNSAFPARRGFGTTLFLTNQAIAGQLDASHRTKVYASMEEVAADFDAGDSFYDASLAAFGQDPRPILIKAAYYDVPTGGLTKNDMLDELDAIYDVDREFYFITIEKSLRDTAGAQAVIEWTQTKNKLAIIDSNDPDTELVNTSSIAGLNKGLYDRTAVFYHTDDDEYGGVALAATLSTYNFDESNAAYTAKYKRLEGVSVLDKPSSVITAITGFTEQLGQSLAAGNMANTQIDIGGQPWVAEGSTLTPNTFIDEIHATDWIIARTEEETLGILLNNKRIPFTDAGMEMLAAGARAVMKQAQRTGIIAEDLDPETGDYKASVEFIIPSALDVPESQRKARIAPDIQVRFRYAGAVHYTTIRYQMAF